jgi:3-oxoadipate enol-lactonase
MQSHDDHFRSGEASLRFRDDGAGPPVVFIHGWTLDLEAWNPQAAALAGSFRVVRHDRRGFGHSEGVPGRVADQEDLVRLLDHLQLVRATLVGHSQGARVALAFAIAHAERVAGLVLDGPPDEAGNPDTPGDGDFSIAEYRRLVRDEGVDAFRSAWRVHPLMQLQSNDMATRELVDRMLARYPARDLLGPVAVPATPVGASVLARLRLPALVMNGALDTPIRLSAGEALARALPRAERVVVPCAGHLPNLDNTSAYNEAIQAFLRRQSRAAA